MDRYVSANKGLASLAAGGALILVTVRPPERLWLVAILEAPAFEETMWRASPSDVPITDVTDLLPRLRLASGAGIQAPEGKLGMSLQTPRVLADEDVALLRAACAGATPTAPDAPAKATPAAAKPSAKPARTPAPAATKAPPAASPPAAPAKPTPASPPPAAAAPAIAVSAAAPDAPAPRRAAGPLPAAAAALFARIVADPDDLGARGVYADALTEVGDPHGEYIQLTLAAAGLDEDAPKRAELDALATALARRHRGSLAFSAPLRQIPFFNRSAEGTWNIPFSLARGFPELARSDKAKDLLPVLPDASRAAPIRALAFRETTTDDLERLAQMPELARIRELRVQSTPDAAAGLVALLRSPHLVRLERLALTCPLPQAVLDAMTACPALDGMTTLTLHPVASVQSQAADVSALLRSPRLSRMRELALGGVVADADAIGALSLTSLTLSGGTKLGAKGATTLAKAEACAHLRTLRLAGVDIPDKELLVLLGSPRLEKLRSLTLEQMVNGKKLAAALDALARPALRELWFAASPLREEGAEALVAARDKLVRLTKLGLEGAALKDTGAIALARLALPALSTLDLDGNAIGPAGMAALGAGPLLSTVRDLSLRKNKCGTEGGLALAKAKRLGGLRRLVLFYNWMGVKGVRAILEGAPALEELQAGENNYGDEPARFFANAPGARVRVLALSHIEQETVDALVKSPAATTLEELQLGSSGMTTTAAEALTTLPALETLALVFTSVDAPGRAALRRRFGPNLTIWGRTQSWDDPGPP